MDKPKSRIGYEITVKRPEEEVVYCVDDKRKIRGWYVRGYRRYFSDWKLWADDEGSGDIRGELKEGKIVSITKEGKTKEFRCLKSEK